MKDIHSHILFSIDDGAEDINESIDIIKQAIDNGYTDIILTPHYRKRQGFVANNKINLHLLLFHYLNINLYLIYFF